MALVWLAAGTGSCNLDCMSLRTKFLLAAAVAVLLPLLGYLLLDTLLTRSLLVRDHAASLRMSAELLSSSLGGCAPQSCDPQTHAATTLRRFAEAYPDLEVMLLDRDSRVFAASRAELQGQRWREEAIDQVLRGESDFVWGTMDHHREAVLDISVPLRGLDEGELLGAVHLARSLAAVERQVSDVRLRHLAFVVLVSLAVGIVLSLGAFRLVIRRLSRLDGELRSRHEIEAGGKQAATAGDEIDHLAAALHAMMGHLASNAQELGVALQEKEELLLRLEGFNTKLEREVDRTRRELLRTQGELLRAEHLSTVGQLAAGLAHELRNPLFIIRATAESYARRHAEAAPMTADVCEEVDRVDGIITRLLDLARPLSVERRSVSLRELLQECVERVGRRLGETRSELRLVVDPGPAVVVLGDEALLRQVFINLLDNACAAIEGPGTVQISVRAEPGGGGATVLVKDTGCGIRSEDAPHIFEPFFTRKPGGAGLGLCSVKKILGLHGAAIALDNTGGQGTTFVVSFGAETAAPNEA